MSFDEAVHAPVAEHVARVARARHDGEVVALASALDAAFLAIVREWALGGEGCSDEQFDALARATFAYQRAANEPYARYLAALGYDAAFEPATWREIPAVPSSAFKDAALATFPIETAELVFHTSGTTAERSGKHYLQRAALYDAALLAGFDRFMLQDGAKLRYLNFVPNPRVRPHSSLGYMMGSVSVLRGDGKAAYFLDDDRVDVDGFALAMNAAIKQGQPVCVAGTAFAFAALLDELGTRNLRFAAPAGSRIMETGGFKGRTAVVERADLYAGLERALGIAQRDVIAEYGMTELVSQYYDAPASRGPIDDARAPRIKVGPPWLRASVVDGEARAVSPGSTGFLKHVDLGNRSSVVAILTEDRGYAVGADEGFVLLGRDLDAPARGCSLDAEGLLKASLASAFQI